MIMKGTFIMNTCECNCDSHLCNKDNEMLTENSIDLLINDSCKSEIRADIILNKLEVITIYGQVKDCEGCPISNVLIKLMKCCGNKLKEVDCTTSDCQGFYLFKVYLPQPKGNYRLIFTQTDFILEDIVYNPICKNCKQNKENCSINNFNRNTKKFKKLNNTDCCESKVCEYCKTCEFYDETLKKCTLNN